MGRICRVAIRWCNIMADPTLIILYTTPKGSLQVEMLLRNETVWLTQKALAELFGVSPSNISRHLEKSVNLAS